MRPKVAILTLGCRVNQSESSVIEGTLRQHGVQIVGLEEHPDICILNTCTVTRKSDANSRQLIRKAAKTGAEIIVTGCYSELNNREASGIPGVSRIVPSKNKDVIIAHVLNDESVIPLYNLHDRARPFLKVQDGCNFSCSYCAVPMARGRSRSVPLEVAVKRATQIAMQGYNEIVLTGIHLGSFGQDLHTRVSLSGLIKEILRSTDIARVRLSSIEINEVDDELIELLKDPRICSHLHLPLQSGSDRILGLMNRNYTAKTYERKLERIAQDNEQMAFGTDIIIGFPSETEDDFLCTYNYLKNLPFSYLHVFPYSPRSGTAANSLKSQIASELIAGRAEALKCLNQAKRERYASVFIGKILDIVAEEPDGSGEFIGTSSNYLKVRVRADNARRGTLMFVRLEASDKLGLRGTVIS